MDIQSIISSKGETDLFVTYDNKYSIEYTNIEEYGMMKFISSVQIWNGIESSNLIYISSKIKYEYQFARSCYYLDKSDIVVLLTPCLHKNQTELLYVLFDFNKNVFGTICDTEFQLKELNKNIVKLELDFRYSYDEETKKRIALDNGKLINLTVLNWYDIKSIDNLCHLRTKNNS